MRDWNWLRPHTLNLYEYVGNDPVNAWDPTGFSTYVLAWATKEGSVGHAAIGVDEYVKGKPTGNVNIYDKFPAPGHEVGPYNFTENIPGETLMTTVPRKDLLKFYGREGQDKPVEGVLELNTSPEVDALISKEMNGAVENNADYNGRDANCSDLVVDGLKAGNINLNADETLYPKLEGSVNGPEINLTTPNKVYKGAESLPGSEILKKPGKSINNTAKSTMIGEGKLRQMKGDKLIRENSIPPSL